MACHSCLISSTTFYTPFVKDDRDSEGKKISELAMVIILSDQDASREENYGCI